MALKLFQPYVSEQAKQNVQRVLSSGFLAEGEEVKLFEHEFATKFNKQNVVAVNSGTSALELAYELAGINDGDEVITPVLTCTATNIPLVRRKARIVFADIDYDLNINTEDVKKKITPQTKAIVFVHFGGNNRGLAELLEIGRERGISIIEDAAQAIGSDYWGYGDFTCVSLQAIKTLTAGDGGILLCKKNEDTAKAKRLRWFGYDRDLKHKFGDTDLTEAGYKYHMNNISAAVARGNLAEINRIFSYKKAINAVYASKGLFTHAWLSGGFTDDYEALRAKMELAGVEIGQHHYRNDKYTLFKPYKTDCPVMDELEGKYYFVPSYMGVSLQDAERISSLI